jgi:hypothetical protein
MGLADDDDDDDGLYESFGGPRKTIHLVIVFKNFGPRKTIELVNRIHLEPVASDMEDSTPGYEQREQSQTIPRC